MNKKLFIVFLTLTILSACSESGQNSTSEETKVEEIEETATNKVYQTNLSNKFIDKDGVMLLYDTNNPALVRGCYYEYANEVIQANTFYELESKGEKHTIKYVHSNGSNSCTQIIETPATRGISAVHFDIADNQKIEHNHNGMVFEIYRKGDFIDLLKISDIRGNLIMKN